MTEPEDATGATTSDTEGLTAEPEPEDLGPRAEDEAATAGDESSDDDEPTAVADGDGADLEARTEESVEESDDLNLDLEANDGDDDAPDEGDIEALASDDDLEASADEADSEALAADLDLDLDDGDDDDPATADADWIAEFTAEHATDEAADLLDEAVLDEASDSPDQHTDSAPEPARELAAVEDHDIAPATGTVRWIEPAGLDRFDGVDLVEDVVGRDLTDDEQSWASAYNDHVDGTPRTLVLAAAVIRAAAGSGAALPPADDPQAVVARVIEGCDAPVRQALRILESLRPRGVEATGAAALGAEHLAVLTAGVAGSADGAASLDDPRSALAAGLVETGLVEAETDPYGVQRLRLADGVVIGDNVAGWIPAVAQELAAWASRVGPLEASGEAEAAIVAVQGAVALERLPVARMLARAMAPALAATLRWDQWATVLEAGRDASLRATAAADAGYFHHELAIRALCLGEPDVAAAELTAAVRAYTDAGDERRGGAARRAATVAGIALPDALLAVPEAKGALAKKYKGIGSTGPKKVTVGTASAMVLFGVAAVGILVGAVGGGSGGGAGGGGSVAVAKNQDQSSVDQAAPFFVPLIIPGAQPPVVEVPKVTPQAPGATVNAQAPQQQVAPTTPARTFLQPTKPVAATTVPQYAPLPSLPSYVPPVQTSSAAPPPVTTPSSLPTLPPPTTPPTTPILPPPTTPIVPPPTTPIVPPPTTPTTPPTNPSTGL